MVVFKVKILLLFKAQNFMIPHFGHPPFFSGQVYHVRCQNVLLLL